MPRVLTAFSRGKFGDPGRNEDAVVSTGDFFAVVDGATAKAPVGQEKSPGRRAAESVVSTIRTMPAGIGAHDAIGVMSEALARLPDSTATDEPPSASVAVYSVHRNEAWVVGDVWVSWDGRAVRFGHEVERRGAAARAALLHAALEHSSVEELLVDDPGRAMILPLLKAEHLLTNLDRDDPLVFGRLDGRPVPDRLVHVLTLPEDWARLVLASDGYPALGGDLDQTEALLARRLREDPLMIDEPPATKGVRPGQESFDDRTWLEIARS